MAGQAPNLKQLAVLDWLRRWPGVYLKARGRWTAQWESEAARLHMMAIVRHLGAPTTPGEGGREGWGTFEGSPHCGSATFRVLLARGWVEAVHSEYGSPCHQLAAPGREVLLRHCFQLRNYQPRPAGQRVKRPIAPSAKVLNRYGGPEGAKRYLAFHEMQADYHSRLADRLRESLTLYEGSPEQRRDEWKARSSRRLV